MKFCYVILFCIALVFPQGNSPQSCAATNELSMESEKSDLDDSLYSLESELEDTELFLLQISGAAPFLFPNGRQVCVYSLISANASVDAQGCRPPPSAA